MVTWDRRKLELYDTECPFHTWLQKVFLYFHSYNIVNNSHYRNKQINKQICNVLIKICIPVEMLESVLSLAKIISCFQLHLPRLHTHTGSLLGRQHFPKECTCSTNKLCLCSLKLVMPLRTDFGSLVLQTQGFFGKVFSLPLYGSVTLQYRCVVNVCISYTVRNVETYFA